MKDTDSSPLQTASDRAALDIKGINNLATAIHADNAAKGFWDEHPLAKALREEFPEPILTPAQSEVIGRVLAHLNRRNVGELLMLMVSELGEALEADRKNLMDDHLPHRKGLEVELADCAIRILDCAGGNQMDLGGAIYEKLAFNRTRPAKHGKKY